MAEKEQVICLRYTKEALRKNKGLGLKEEDMYPHEYLAYVDTVRQALNSDPNKTVDYNNISFKIVTIDDIEYVKWLKKNNKKDSDNSRCIYGKEISEEKASKILKDNNLNYTYNFMFLPIFAIGTGKEISAQLEIEEKNALIKALEKIYGKGNIYVPGHIISSTIIKDNGMEEVFDYFINIAVAHFENDIDITRIKYKDIKIKKDAATLCLLPVFRRHISNNIVFEFKDGENEEVSAGNYPEYLISEEQYEEFNNNPILMGLSSRLMKDYSMAISPDLCNFLDLESSYDGIMNKYLEFFGLVRED